MGSSAPPHSTTVKRSRDRLHARCARSWLRSCLDAKPGGATHHNMNTRITCFGCGCTSSAAVLSRTSVGTKCTRLYSLRSISGNQNVMKSQRSLSFRPSCCNEASRKPAQSTDETHVVTAPASLVHGGGIREPACRPLPRTNMGTSSHS